jgi:serine/threonine-protein kinase RsbW
MEYFEFASVIERPISIAQGGFRMTIAHDLKQKAHRGPHIALESSLPSEVSAISPFVDKLMLLLRNCGCVPESVSDVDIALREALANAIIHGNHEDPRKHVHVKCCCQPDEVSIVVKDEGKGFDVNNVPDPTASENIVSVHGRGIHVIRALMDEVHFQEGGTVIHMRKSAGEAPKLLAKDAHENSTN